MHDFLRISVAEMLNSFLAGEVKYLKETEGSQGRISKVLEEMCAEAAREAEYEKAIQIARQMLAKDIFPGIVSECTGLSLDTVLELVGMKNT